METANAQRTFLHPNTRDPATLERLANVPSGTYERLMVAKRESPRFGQAAKEHWARYRGTPELKLWNFMLQGYGPIGDAAKRVLHERGLPIKGGTTNDPTVKQALLGGREDPGLELTWFSQPL